MTTRLVMMTNQTSIKRIVQKFVRKAAMTTQDSFREKKKRRGQYTIQVIEQIRTWTAEERTEFITAITESYCEWCGEENCHGECMKQLPPEIIA